MSGFNFMGKYYYNYLKRRSRRCHSNDAEESCMEEATAVAEKLTDTIAKETET